MNIKQRPFGLKTSRRGFVLPLVMIMMLFLVIICGAVLAMAHMNVRYDSTFEQWSIMEHATMSVADIMAKNLAANGETYSWGSPPVEARGSFSFDITGDDPPMWFTYVVSTDTTGKKYTLTVNGGYKASAASEAGKKTWKVVVKNIASGDKTFDWDTPSKGED
ncbi:hypothetical protein AGMMS50276_11930 [Synergistales bacterium]|nr:hypothetical protein AGMMS50276_11930 [Synergistales bacterium]